MKLPPYVSAELSRTLSEFWTDRLRQHTHDTYKSRTLAKMPEDLRTYQHVIEDTRPEVVVELGTYAGGSALWFADQLKVLCGIDTYFGWPSVITIDVDTRGRDPGEEEPLVAFLHGKLQNDAIIEETMRLIDGRRTMVVEDAAHTYECTIEALTLYSDFVSPGCYFVVEDAIVDRDDLTLPEWHSGGVDEAILRFLDERGGFTQEFLAPYGLTTDNGGWLRRHG